MTRATTPAWESKRTPETREVEKHLKKAKFKQVDAYRYNSAVIRVRVIDPRFEGKSRTRRDAMVEPYLDQLPTETQQDIVTLLMFAPSEIKQSPTLLREYVLNVEFEEAGPPML